MSESMPNESTESITSLTRIEKDNLAELETAIQKSLTGFCEEVGFSLGQIRDNRLYRETHGTFELYCQERWGISRPRAYQFIKAAEVLNNLSTAVDKPIAERHLRLLAPLPLDQQRQVYQKLLGGGPEAKLTSKHIRKAIGDVTGGKQPSTKEGVTEEPIEETARGITHPEIEINYTEVTDAMEFAGMAISQLERIRDDDPMRKEGIKKVADWCQTNLN